MKGTISKQSWMKVHIIMAYKVWHMGSTSGCFSFPNAGPAGRILICYYVLVDVLLLAATSRIYRNSFKLVQLHLVPQNRVSCNTRERTRSRHHDPHHEPALMSTAGQKPLPVISNYPRSTVALADTRSRMACQIERLFSEHIRRDVIYGKRP